jgi:hypothetical protein
LSGLSGSTLPMKMPMTLVADPGAGSESSETIASASSGSDAGPKPLPGACARSRATRPSATASPPYRSPISTPRGPSSDSLKRRRTVFDVPSIQAWTS